MKKLYEEIGLGRDDIVKREKVKVRSFTHIGFMTLTIS